MDIENLYNKVQSTHNLPYKTLRPNQIVSIKQCLQNENSFINLPTGGGKTYAMLITQLILKEVYIHERFI